MAIEYILAPNPLWSALKQVGVPAANGYVFTYTSGTRDYKATYLDPAGLNPNDNPIRLSSAGEATIYWAIEDGEPLYTIAVYAASGVDGVPGQLILTVDNYPTVGGAAGSPIITIYAGVNNYFANEQFTWWTHGTSFDATDLIAGDTPIADAWLYRRDNTDATLSIYRVAFDPETNPPPGTAPYYLEYECTAAASDVENTILQKFDSVQTLANVEVTVGFWARTRDPFSVSTVSIYVEQYFGVGGSATPPVTLYSKAIDENWTYCFETFTVPSIIGKTIGTGGDDYLAIGFQFQINQIIAIDITDVAFQIGIGTGVNFPYRTQNQQYNELLQYILAGYSDQEGTNIIGWSATETLHDFLLSLIEGSQFENFLIGWAFINNPNQFGRDFPNTNDGQYICDQTILVSDGNDIVTKNTFTGEPLELTVAAAATKFGIFQIIEYTNSNYIRDEYVSILSQLKSTTSCTVKMAVLGWSGTPQLETRACVQAWNGAGVDPTLATGWDYVSDIASFTIDSLSENTFNKLEAQLLDSSSSFGLLIWVDSNTLGIGDVVTFYQGSLVRGNYASLAQTLDFGTVLRQCQRYYYRTYASTEETAEGAITNSNAPLVQAQGIDNSFTASFAIWPNTGTDFDISSNAVSHLFPVEMYREPGLTFFNPYTGAAGTARIDFDGNPIGTGTVDLAVSSLSSTPLTANFWIENGGTYGLSGGSKGFCVYYYHFVADARLGV